MAYQLDQGQRSMMLRDLLSNPDQENLAVAQGITQAMPYEPSRSVAGVAEQAPLNMIRNNSTGRTFAPTDMQGNPSQSQPAGPDLDYSSPIEMAGLGKGYRLKGDGTRAFINGQMVDMGRDTGAERARMKESLAIAKARQDLTQGDVESQIKRAQLMELMGQDPSQMGAGGQGQQSPQDMAGQVSASRQKFLARRFGAPPTGSRWDEAGNAVAVPGVEKPLTEFQGKSSGFGVRAASAHEQLNALEGGGLGGEYDSLPGYRNGPVQPGMIKRMGEALPLVGEGLGTILNATQSSAQKRVDQAQRNFVNATLRQESGAAIPDSEWDNAKKQYFPQPGDDPATIEQKRLNREQVISGFKTSAGKDGAGPITPAQSSMRENLQREMATRAEAIAVIKSNPAARAEVIKRMQAMKFSTKGL